MQGNSNKCFLQTEFSGGHFCPCSFARSGNSAGKVISLLKYLNYQHYFTAEYQLHIQVFLKFLETLEPAKTSKQNIIVIIPTCHYTYSAIFTSSIWNYFDTNFLVSFKCFDIFLDRNPSKCWTLKEETWQGLNTRYSHFATGQTVFRVLFRCMGMMISGHHTSFTSNLFWN